MESKNLKKVIIGGALLVVVGAAVITINFFSGSRRSISPALLDYGRNQKVSEKSTLIMSFPAAMNPGSVEDNLEIPAGLKGESKWEGPILTFRPQGKLKLGETYTFRVARNALFANGKPVNQDMEYHFTVAGNPRISMFLPSMDAIAIPMDAKITLIFDRPMIPLSAVQGSGAQKYQGEWPVKITPAIEGRWRWLSTTTVEFKPTQGFVAATKYTVNVPKGITTLNGDPTTEERVWSFETVRPEIIGSDPSEGYTLAGPTTVITLNTTAVIDLASAQTKIALAKIDPQNPAKTEVHPIIVGYGTDLVDEKEVINQKKLKITPQAPLERSSAYRLTVQKDLKGIIGELGTTADFSVNFKTVGDLNVKKGLWEGNTIQIRFSNPLDDKTLKDQIIISPAVKGWKELSWISSEGFDGIESYASVVLYPALQASTNYAITVQAGTLQDRFGQGLKEPYIFSFKTPELAPRVDILSKGEFAIFEKNKAPLYPIQAVNISQLNLELARIPFGTFLKIRQERMRNGEYQPQPFTLPEYQKISLPIKKPLNSQNIINVDTQKEFKKEWTPGVYFLSVEAPEYKQTWNNNKPIVQFQYFTLTNIALTLKYSGNKALVWAVDMEKGLAVENAEVAFHKMTGEKIVSGRTDTNGFFETDVDLKKFQGEGNEWNPEFWVTAQKGNDFAFISNQWNSGIEPWSFNVSEEFHNLTAPEDRLEGIIYTERQVYRPGDTVFFKGVVRLRSLSGELRLPQKGVQMTLNINDPQGKEVYKKSLALNEFGSFADQFPVAAEGALGYYYMNAQMIPETSVDRNYLSGSFSVLAYRKPEYAVNMEPQKQEYFDGDKVGFNLESHYYFGAPMNNAKVQWHSASSDYFFNTTTGDGWYSFNVDSNCWWQCPGTNQVLTQGEGALDSNGKLHIEFPVDLKEKENSQIISVEATITDLNNQAVSQSTSVVVHKSKVYVGVRTEDYAVKPEQEAKIHVLTVNTDTTPAPNQKVTLRLYSRVWNTIKKKSVDGEYYYDNEFKDTYLRQTSVTTDEKGKGVAPILIGKGGSYWITAETKDSDGHVGKAGTTIYAFSDTYINWPRSNNDRIDVVNDKPEYKLGDTAKLLIKSPWQGVKALVTVERENVLTRQVIDITGNGQPVEIPITEELLPNAYVSVVIIKPRQGSTFDENGKDTGAPAFKIGYATLYVQTSGKRLKVELKSDRPKYGPGEEATINLTVHDAEGLPVQAEISLGVVDLSLEALVGYWLPDLVSNFYMNRGLGVRTAQMLIYLVETFKPGSKGGGGGAENRPRGDFKDTAYWNPRVMTNDQGKASVTFTLPDNLTTWKASAVAQTKEHLFGSGDTTFIETKKTILRPVRPRFAVQGDEMELGAVVHNFTDTKQTYIVSLTGEGFEAIGSKGSLEQRITVKPNESKKVLFPARIQKSDKATLRFKAQSDEGIDEVTESIPVYAFGTPQSVATSGILEKGSVTENIFVPAKSEASQGSILTTLSPTVAAYLPKGLEYLSNFPYGCAEQVASSFLPNVALASLQGFDAFKIVSSATLEKNVLAGLQKLYSFQRGDGGFGYFETSDQSYPYLSTYLLYALHMTQKAGHAVDQGTIDRARDYLTSVLRDPALNGELDLTTRAYILYVLAEQGSVDSGLINNLYDQRKDLPLFAKAHLALSLQKDSNAKRAQKVLEEIMNHIKIDSRGAHFEEVNSRWYGFSMNTDTRTSALVLQALIRISPRHDLVPKLVRYLLAVREQGHWDTTQSSVQSIFALIDFLNSTGELQANFKTSVAINGKEIANTAFNVKNVLTKKEVSKEFNQLKADAMNTLLITKDTGPGRVYYDVLMNYFLTLDTLPPADEGIAIERKMTPLYGKNNPEKITEGKLLETYKTTLTITVPEERHFVAVESPLPAGFEAIDFSLNTAQQGLQNQLQGDNLGWNWWNSNNQIWRFMHREFRDDRVFLFAENLPAGVYEYEYLVRATTPGHFRYRPARAWEMYFPETFGQTEGGWLDIKN